MSAGSQQGQSQSGQEHVSRCSHDAISVHHTENFVVCLSRDLLLSPTATGRSGCIPRLGHSVIFSLSPSLPLPAHLQVLYLSIHWIGQVLLHCLFCLTANYVEWDDSTVHIEGIQRTVKKVLSTFYGHVIERVCVCVCCAFARLFATTWRQCHTYIIQVFLHNDNRLQ